MLRHQTDEAKREYHFHQQKFKQKVWELKSGHWRKFLVEKGPDHAYCAYKLTRDQQVDKITLLRDGQGNLTSDVRKNVSLLFHRTLLTQNPADLQYIPEQQPPSLPLDFPPVTNVELLLVWDWIRQSLRGKSQVNSFELLK
ncbi:hypothetical protein O181_069011 [Austropuccinia psidii MF-1]|uniref:Uncharacterized protein n=1 Tax=Austropuccinia psidii MF-1 TaxID=1389203 RepID=A0A9Q3F2P5_9BASI|nr:hypothetical protein [Austropuccinia psidii MF-1]